MKTEISVSEDVESINEIRQEPEGLPVIRGHTCFSRVLAFLPAFRGRGTRPGMPSNRLYAHHEKMVPVEQYGYKTVRRSFMVPIHRPSGGIPTLSGFPRTPLCGLRPADA